MKIIMLFLLISSQLFSQKNQYIGKIEYMKEVLLSSGHYDSAKNGKSTTYFNLNSYLYLQRIDLDVGKIRSQFLQSLKGENLIDSFEIERLNEKMRRKLEEHRLKSFTRIEYASQNMIRSRGDAEEPICVMDTLKKIDWKLLNDTATIEGIICQKAVGSFYGKLYNVWFSSKINFPAGPMNMNGLPGLIIYAETEDKKMRYRMTSIEYPLQKGIEFDECKGKSISNEEYMKNDSERKAELLRKAEQLKNSTQKKEN